MKKFLLYAIVAFSPIIASAQLSSVQALSAPVDASVTQLSDFDNTNLREVVSVSVKDGVYDIIFKDRPVPGVCRIRRTQILGTCDGNFGIIKTSFFWPTISITSVPFKVRPKNGKINHNASSSLTNLGAVVSFFGYNADKYFLNGKITNHKWVVGALIAPGVEKYTEQNAPGIVGEENHLTLSTGLAISYSYQGVTFTAIPIGVDYGLSGQNDLWSYHGNYWYGFGIGIDIKRIGGIF